MPRSQTLSKKLQQKSLPVENSEHGLIKKIMSADDAQKLTGLSTRHYKKDSQDLSLYTSVISEEDHSQLRLGEDSYFEGQNDIPPPITSFDR